MGAKEERRRIRRIYGHCGKDLAAALNWSDPGTGLLCSDGTGLKPGRV
jgi:hypothetical protein